jgi:alpha-mannosidase
VRHLASGREAIAPGGAANLAQIHPDLPNAWDAWDIDAHYRNVVHDVTDVASLTSDGESVRVRRRHGASTITQTVTVRAGEPVVLFQTEVDWHERERLLKVAFPLDLHTDRFAGEIQYGHVWRATHTNTSWEAAKFEVPAHRWVQVGEPDWGVAIVNDSTYGHDVTRDRRADGGTTTTVRLSLLRAPRFPDPETDQGSHRFGYALVPGAGVADAVREGYRLNLPERRALGNAPVAPLVTVDSPAVVVEAVKLADDGSGDLVVRLYEALGTTVAPTVGLLVPVGRVTVTDLLERDLPDAGDLDVADGRVALTLRPFQIVTLRGRLSKEDIR